MSGLVGVKVSLGQQCRCGENTLLVGPGRGPHIAILRCARCSKFVCWLSKSDAAAVSEVIAVCGKDEVVTLCK